jgi:hypothetical protein
MTPLLKLFFDFELSNKTSIIYMRGLFLEPDLNQFKNQLKTRFP